jgi:hypothetical protein
MFDLIQHVTILPTPCSVPQLPIDNHEFVDPIDFLAPSHVAIHDLHCLPKSKISLITTCHLSSGYLRNLSSPLESRRISILISSFTIFLNHHFLAQIRGSLTSRPQQHGETWWRDTSADRLRMTARAVIQLIWRMLSIQLV